MLQTTALNTGQNTILVGTAHGTQNQIKADGVRSAIKNRVASISAAPAIHLTS